MVRGVNDLVRVDSSKKSDDVKEEIKHPSEEPKNIVENKKQFTCIKCNKTLSSNQQLKLHNERCTGLHPLQCPICLKMFASKQGKYEHKKYVKCSPPIQTSNNTINNNYNNCNNTTNNNNFYSINIRADFDKISNEDIQNMVSRITKAEYLKIVNKNIDIGKYVIPRTLEHIYFNDNFPEMQAIKKERRNKEMEQLVGDKVYDESRVSL